MSDLTFTSTLQELPVKIDKKDYILKEATGGAVVVYRNSMMRGMTLRDGKPQKLQDVGEVNLLLLSYCLFELKEKDGQNQEVLVGLQTIKKWPNRIQSSLLKELKEISDLEEEGVDERDSLLEALKRSDSPTSLESFRGWVKTLVEEDEKTYESLWDLIKPTAEESAKND